MYLQCLDGANASTEVLGWSVQLQKQSSRKNLRIIGERYMKAKQLIASTAFALAALWQGSAMAGTQSNGQWQHTLTIYAWLPSIDGTLSYDDPQPARNNVEVDAGDLLDKLKMVFMGNWESRREKLSIFADVVYLRLGDTNNTSVNLGPGIPLDVKVDQDLTAWMVTGALGYNVVNTDKAMMDVIGGVRYLSVDAEAKLEVNGPLPPTPAPRKLDGSETLWDGIVGVRGQLKLNDRWYLPYYADIGAGSSSLTYQLLAGVGYRFDKVDVKLAYRHLFYDQSGDKLLQDVTFSGPALGVGFKF